MEFSVGVSQALGMHSQIPQQVIKLCAYFYIRLLSGRGGAFEYSKNGFFRTANQARSKRYANIPGSPNTFEMSLEEPVKHK